jgi:hypothetical protein
MASKPDKKRTALILRGWIGDDVLGFYMALSERYGELPDLQSDLRPARLQIVEGKVKPKDKRDVDRDDALVAELEARAAHYAEQKAHAHSRTEFALRSARGLYSETEPAESVDLPVSKPMKKLLIPSFGQPWRSA